MEVKKIFNIIGLIAIIVVLAMFFSKYIPEEDLPEKQKKQWVWVELKTELLRDTTDYYYFGQIKQTLLEKIDANEDIQGLFKLSNIRYWNDENLLELYEDEENSHYRFFRLQAIQEIIPYKGDPINLYDIEDLDESVKELRDTTNN